VDKIGEEDISSYQKITILITICIFIFGSLRSKKKKTMALQTFLKPPVIIKNAITSENHRVKTPEGEVVGSFSTRLPHYDQSQHELWAMMDFGSRLGKCMIDREDVTNYLLGGSKDIGFTLSLDGKIEAIEIRESVVCTQNGTPVSVVDAEKISSTAKICRICQKNTIDTQPSRCGQCKSVYYCSRACQLFDWVHHKPMCIAIKEFIDKKESSAAAAAAAYVSEEEVPRPASKKMITDSPVDKHVSFSDDNDERSLLDQYSPPQSASNAHTKLGSLCAPTATMAERHAIYREVDDLTEMLGAMVGDNNDEKK
jgi:hypothetical protein